MAETSRSQVTITLGRSGQVVKRAGAVLDREFSDPVPAVGSKRSVRDRLGGSVDAVQFDNKRLRGDNGRLSFNPSNSLDDFHLSKDDLRFKIMKRTQTNGHQNTVDLRDMLSRRARSSTTNPNTSPRHTSQSQRVPETRRIPEPRDSLVNLQRMPPRNERHDDMLDPRDKRQQQQHMSHPQDERQQQQQRVPHSNGGITGQFTSMRTSSEGGSSSSHRGILGNSYSPSPWSLDHIRRKSPPPRRIEEPQRRMVTREYENINPRIENPRTLAYNPSSRDVNVGEVARPPMGMSMTTTTSFLPKPSLSVGPTKPLGHPSLPPGGTMQRSQYPVEHVTVEGFLRSLGLEKYLISFKVEEVDMAALSQMGDHDLKELGIPMGPRKKILLALIARNRRQAR